ncbi:hypothetical protein RRF57_008059 [Xylaria bambusicola]|uniref:Uncharacterized protein n=1 Tax=Xylaria bambusicola TaxID=326684 RepID=A0AAN7Z0C2_9PEZI
MDSLKESHQEPLLPLSDSSGSSVSPEVSSGSWGSFDFSGCAGLVGRFGTSSVSTDVVELCTDDGVDLLVEDVVVVAAASSLVEAGLKSSGCSRTVSSL